MKQKKKNKKLVKMRVKVMMLILMMKKWTIWMKCSMISQLVKLKFLLKNQ